MPAIDFMPSQIANGTLSCIFVIVFTEAKSFLSSSLSICHQPVYVQAGNLFSQLDTEGIQLNSATATCLICQLQTGST